MKRISTLEPGILILGVILSVISAAICMQIMGQLGSAPNTSLIGAVFVMLVARIPLQGLQKFRNPERQNYVLSAASAAGFTAATCGFVAIGTVFLMSRSDLVLPIAAASLIGSMITVFIAGRIFDSGVFPAAGPWPMGAAVAQTIKAGDSGGKKAFELLQGLLVGVLAGIIGVPAAGVGIAFIANMFAMGALAVGMILRGHSTSFFGGFDIGQSNIAQGLMIGAGAVALFQIIYAITAKKDKKADVSDITHTVSNKTARRTIVGSVGLFAAGAVAVAFITGAFADMSAAASALWVAYAGISATMVMILVGTASMQTGWAPGFAVVTIFLTIGIFIGFPPVALAVLVGYIGSVGLPLADTGIGLKTGWLIRGSGANKKLEIYGRRQQVIIKQIGVVVGIGVAVLFSIVLINQDIIPPMSIFYAYTVETAVESGLVRQLALWAIPGAILQAAFGNKSVGLMLATGLLINNPIFGITILSAIVLRLIIGTKFMAVRAPGLIAGDGLFGFGANIFRSFF